MGLMEVVSTCFNWFSALIHLPKVRDCGVLTTVNLRKIVNSRIIKLLMSASLIYCSV